MNLEIEERKAYVRMVAERVEAENRALEALQERRGRSP